MQAVEAEDAVEGVPGKKKPGNEKTNKPKARKTKE